MKSFLRYIVIFFIFIALAGTTVLALQPRIPISGLASFAAGVFNIFSEENLTIQGSYYLTPGEWILLEVNKGVLEMGEENDPTMQLDIVRAEIKFNILSLFKKELILDGVSMQGFSLNIAQREKQNTEHTAKKQKSDETAVSLPLALKQTGNIDISDFSVSLTKITTDAQTTHLQIDEFKGGVFNATAGKLEIKGAINNHVLHANLDIGPLANLSPETPLPFSARLTHKSLMAVINGQASFTKGALNLESDFLFSGDHFDDLTSALGMQGTRNIPFSTKGQASFSSHKTRVLLTQLSPLAENLTASLTVKQNTHQRAKYAVFS